MTREEIRCWILYGPFREDGLPADLATWPKADLELGRAISREIADQSKQELEYAEWMDLFLYPLWDQHPEKTLGQIAEMLPEPEKTFVKDHLEQRLNWSDLPFECRPQYRQEWHGQAESVLQKMLTSDNGKRGFTMKECLRESGIGKQHQQEAARYIEVLLANGQTPFARVA